MPPRLTQFLFRPIPVVLSVWILSLTAYYCINAPWLRFFNKVRPDTKQLIADALKFHWVPVLLSQFPYVFYALILNFIAMLIGNRIFRWLSIDFDSNINKIVFSVPLGWSIYSIGIFYLGVSGLLYKEVVYCFITLLGILSIFEIKRFFREWKALVTPTLPSPLEGEGRNGGKWKALTTTSSRFKLDKSDLIFLPVIIIFITVQLVISFSPVINIDATTYHMALPKLYIKHHALIHVPGFFYATLPAHTEMLYLLGLITSGETLSKLFSFSISSMFLISVFSIGNRYLSKGVGYLAVVVMMLYVPTFLSLFSEPYADVALGLFALLGIYAFFIWIEDLSSNEVKERREGYLYLSILCCSLAAATKIQGLLFVLLFFVGFLVTVKQSNWQAGKLTSWQAKKLAWCILAVCIIALPWYIRSWWLTGDPIFPFLYKYLGANYWNKYSNECFWALHSKWEGVKSISHFISINRDLFYPSWEEKISIYTSLSPIFVIFLIPALIMFKWGKKHDSLKASRHKAESFVYPCSLLALFFIAIVYYFYFIFTSPQVRFFHVASAILSIMVAYFIKMVWTKYLLTRIPVILCIVSLFVTSFFLSVKWIEGPFFVGLGVIDQRKFLKEHSYYRIAAWVNENLPQDSKILSWKIQVYHLDREYIRVNPAFQGVLDFSQINDAMTFLKSIKELGITHLVYDYKSFAQHEHIKRFLDKCVFELFASGKIRLIMYIDTCAIYAVR